MYHNRKALRNAIKSNPPPPNNWKHVKEPWHWSEKAAVFGFVVCVLMLYHLVFK